jgi:hypothetical protein
VVVLLIINAMPELEKETGDIGMKKFVKPILGILIITMFFGVHDWKSRSPNRTDYLHVHQNILSPT